MRAFLPLLFMPMLASAVEFQPLAAQARRVSEALEALGEPLPTSVRTALDSAIAAGDAAKLEAALESQVLFVVTINAEMRVKVAPGPARPELIEAGWRQFLVKVVNEAGTTAPLHAESPHAQKVYSAPERRRRQPTDSVAPAERWLDLAMADARPMMPTLSGLALDYRIVQLYSRDAGKREARISFDVGQGTQDLGFRAEADVLFTVAPAREITLRVKDENGAPTTAAFLIRDAAGRVHPSQAKRVAPDFFFHPQIYRNDGEKIRLPDGEYTIDLSRGPESVPEIRSVKVGATTSEVSFATKRWIDPSLAGWWSGDHHIHAAGCAHYTSPSEGVHAPDMARQCRGEDLKIGANLTWGPCFDYQKQFFTGKEDVTSQWPYLLRYDVEVSGFGSHQSGHLCLLRLSEQMYPGGNSSAHWPTLGLNTLRWAKKQGAVCGPAHSGWGLKLPDNTIPNYAVPPFDGIGACEFIVDVTHEVPGPDGKLVPAVDFMSTVDTPATWELNIWYHTLNAGFRTRISGETDFPCIYGERVGLGRSYVKVDDRLSYDGWCEGVRAGRCYVSDGRSHLIDFKAGGVAVGEKGSELRLTASGEIELTARVAALLPQTPDSRLRGLGFFTAPFGKPDEKPFWHIERARLGESREVPLEALVNGEPVAQQRFVADGTQRDVKFRVPIKRSSWVALRILPSSHTNPVFVIVDNKPIRSNKRSIEWCLAGVDACWSQKERTYAPAEHADALAAYDHARQIYRTRLAEAE